MSKKISPALSEQGEANRNKTNKWRGKESLRTATRLWKPINRAKILLHISGALVINELVLAARDVKKTREHMLRRTLCNDSR